MINPVSKKIQERFYPLPNFGDTSRLVSQNYREQKSRSFDPATYYTIRGDHRFTPNSFLMARWTWNQGHSRDYEANLPTIGQRWQTRDTRNFNASYTHTLSSTMINEARFGITYNDNPRNGPLLGKEVVSELGLVGLADNLPDINGVLNLSFSGLGLTSITQTEWRHPGFLNFVHTVSGSILLDSRPSQCQGGVAGQPSAILGRPGIGQPLRQCQLLEPIHRLIPTPTSFSGSRPPRTARSRRSASTASGGATTSS